MLRPNWNDEFDGQQRYEVIVGHASVRVVGASRDEAVAEARRQLCVQMPRMWDVIQALTVDRFTVNEL